MAGVGIAILIIASPSYVNAPGPNDRVFYPDNPLLLNAAGGAVCGAVLNKVVFPFVGRVIAGAGVGDDIISLGISGGVPSSNVGLPGRGIYPSTPVGRSGSPMKVAVPGAPPTNSPAIINGRSFSGHALDQMQGRGIPLSVVENAIQHGSFSSGNTPSTVVFFDAANNVSVVLNSSTGRIITVRQGTP